MLKNPEDRRARRTRRLLKESLLELMDLNGVVSFVMLLYI